MTENGKYRRKRTERSLTREEMLLWKRVQKTVSPLDPGIEEKNLRNELDQWLEEAPSPHKRHTRKTLKTTELPPYRPVISKPGKSSDALRVTPIDEKTARKLTKGRVSIDAKIDLHGMTQEHAHRALARFLQNAYYSGHRMVLVITGKGPSGQGVLKQLVPVWVTAPELSVYVSGQREAHITHGGAGALYLRIRRSRSAGMTDVKSR